MVVMIDARFFLAAAVGSPRRKLFTALVSD